MKPVYHWLQSLTELGYLNSQQKCEFSKKVSKMTSYIYKKFTPTVSMEFYGLKKYTFGIFQRDQELTY